MILVVLAITIAADIAIVHYMPPRWWRAAQDQREAAVERSYRTRSPVFHHTLIPKATVPDTVWGEHRYSVATNSLGFRDRSTRDVPLEATTTRILFIGDSFLEGPGYDYDQTAVGSIAQALRETGVDVLNASVGSYSPAIYFAKIKYLIETAGLAVDEVVVYIDISDAEDDAVSYRLDDQDRVVDTGVSTGRPDADYLHRSALERFLFQRTLLLKTVLFSLRDRRLELAPQDALAAAVNTHRGAWTFDSNLFDVYGRAGLAAMSANMDRLAALLSAHHIPLTIAVYPWPGQILFDTTASIQVTHWREWAARHGAGFLDYFPTFLSPPDPVAVIERFFQRGDVHWNDAGHRAIAEGYLAYRTRAIAVH